MPGDRAARMHYVAIHYVSIGIDYQSSAPRLPYRFWSDSSIALQLFSASHISYSGEPYSGGLSFSGSTLAVAR